MNLKQIFAQVNNLCVSTGDMIKNELGQLTSEDIHNKGVHDYVTFVDTISERRIVKELNNLLPEAGFIVEENTIEHQPKPLMWIIDPLDGTTNFIHGIPCFSISIALMLNNKIILGVVYDIMRDECFYAFDDGAWLNNKPIKVSQTPDLESSILGTGFPSRDYTKLDKYMDVLKTLFINTHGVRRIGSAAIDLCYVASGRFDAFFEYGLKSWDVAAGAFIVEKAGGKVTEFNEGENYIFGNDIIASNGKIHDKIIEIINK
jgi:myo-inositol-1(or 4)-monophosphatase